MSLSCLVWFDATSEITSQSEFGIFFLDSGLMSDRDAALVSRNYQQLSKREPDT